MLLLLNLLVIRYKEPNKSKIRLLFIKTMLVIRTVIFIEYVLKRNFWGCSVLQSADSFNEWDNH